MKHLFIALICLTIGFGASAKDLSIKKDASFINKIDKNIKLSINRNIYMPGVNEGLLKKEKVFRFTDACGVKWDIHVFAPNGTSNWSMWVDASFFFEQGTWGNDGCYHNQP